MDLQPFLDLIAKHQWTALAALVIGCIVRLLKEDSSFPPFAVPARWRPLLAMGLGIVSGVLQAVSTGTPWRDAVLSGLVSGFVAIAGHDAIVGSIRNGKDVPLPRAITVPPEVARMRIRMPKAEPPTPTEPTRPAA